MKFGAEDDWKNGRIDQKWRTLIFWLTCGGFTTALAQGSEDLEIFYFPSTAWNEDSLPLLVRGGSLDVSVYDNYTENDDIFQVDSNGSEVGPDPLYCDPHQPPPPPGLSSNTDLVKRRMPGNRWWTRQKDADNGEEQCLSYSDILECKARRWTRLGNQAPNDFNDDDDYGNNIFRRKNFPDARGGKREGSQKLAHSPVVYQYFGRSRMRGNPTQSLNFILLGPNVDHWRSVGQILASRGFNTIACERVQDDKVDPSNDSPNLVLDILDALKWNKAVLVGCDREAILTMETAMMLAPDRVAGMVLSGDLEKASRVASEAGVTVLDAFLRRILDCPFLIIWDGDSPSIVSGSSAHGALASTSDSTCQILGGGSAPHRTKAEQFAWVLTRFVEEKLEMTSQKTARASREDWRRTNISNQRQIDGRNVFQLINLPFGVDTLVSSEGRLLLGRAVAAALFYITMMKVVVVQYGILRAGLIGIKSKYDSVDALLKRIIQATGAFFLNYGYIPRLFSVKKAKDDDDDDDDRESSIMPSENEELAFEDNEEDASASEIDSDDSLDSLPEEITDEEEETIGKDTDADTEDEILPPEEAERPRFKPFFFLDSVVT